MLDQLLNEEENNTQKPLEQITNEETVEPINLSNSSAPEQIIEEQKEEIICNIDPNKKAILYLINGLGIASKDSFNINYQDVMPNMSMLMGNYLYTSLQNINYNYNNGFRNFSLGNDLLATYHKLDSDINLSENEKIKSIANDANVNKTKIHIFAFLDNDQVVNQAKRIVDALTPKGSFMIYIHIILRQKDINEYDNIANRIKKLDESLTLLPNVKIGVITGERKINTETYYTVISKENGEKWPDYNRKLNFSNAQGIKPMNIDPFYINPGFLIQRNDIALFLNYEDVDCDEFISRITNVKLYTLFPMKSYSYAINLYEELEPVNYFLKTLENNNLTCLILTTPDRIPAINYNLCGLKDVNSQSITYMNITDQNLDIKQIINSDYNYIIFDYDINKFKEIRKIKEFMMHIDDQINDIYNICEEKDYRFVISSLYGIYKKFIVGLDKEVILDYSIEVPAIIIDRNLPKSKFMFKYGTTYNLSNTIFNLITNNPEVPTAIRKRGILSFFKD